MDARETLNDSKVNDLHLHNRMEVEFRALVTDSSREHRLGSLSCVWIPEF